MLIEKGIRRTPTSFQVFAKLKGRFRSRRFPLTKTLKELRVERERLRAEILFGAPSQAKPGESFADDARYYLTLVEHMPSYEDRAYEIRAWIEAFGRLQRSAITSHQIRAQLEKWRKTGSAKGGPLSVSSLNRRRTSLMSLYRTLDGKSAANPVKDVPPYNESHHAGAIRAHAVFRWYRLFVHMRRNSKTLARLRLMLWTGWPQRLIAQLRSDDVDLKRRMVRLRGRRKGKGTTDRWMPLIAPAVTAMQAFIAAKAFQMDTDEPFSTSAMHSALARAVAKENARRKRVFKGAPLPRIRPYDARHTFGTLIARQLRDERAIQDLMLHKTPALTRRYTVGADQDRIRHAVALLNETLATAGNLATRKREVS